MRRSLFWTFAGSFLLVLVTATLLQGLVIFAVVEPLQSWWSGGQADDTARDAAGAVAALDDPTDDAIRDEPERDREQNEECHDDAADQNEASRVDLGVAPHDLLIDVAHDSRRRDEELRVGGRHDGREDRREHQAVEEWREVLCGEEREDRFGVASGERLGGWKVRDRRCRSQARRSP